MGDYLALVLGILTAALGGELFGRGTVGIASTKIWQELRKNLNESAVFEG